jgi:hypothetical protein
MVFLAVEGNGRAILSTDSYAGWTAGLAECGEPVRFLPCIYGPWGWWRRSAFRSRRPRRFRAGLRS